MAVIQETLHPVRVGSAVVQTVVIAEREAVAAGTHRDGAGRLSGRRVAVETPLHDVIVGADAARLFPSDVDPGPILHGPHVGRRLRRSSVDPMPGGEGDCMFPQPQIGIAGLGVHPNPIRHYQRANQAIAG